MAFNIQNAKDLLKGIGQGASDVFSPYAKLLAEPFAQVGRIATNKNYRRAIFNPESFNAQDAAKLNNVKASTFLRPEQIQNRRSIVGAGAGATSKALLGTAGLANPANALLGAGISGGLTYGLQKLTRQPTNFREIGRAVGYSPIYSGINRLTARPSEVIYNTLLPQGASLTARALTRGSVGAGANILEEVFFTPLTQGRRPTKKELQIAAGTGLLAGSASEIFGDAFKKFKKAYKERVNSKAKEKEIIKQYGKYWRNQLGQFAGDPNQPKWIGDVREAQGLDRYGDGPQLGLSTKAVPGKYKELTKTGVGDVKIPKNEPIKITPPGGSGVGTSPVQKITALIKEAKPMRGQSEELYSAERARRVAKAAGVGQNVGGEQGYFAQLGQLKGELPKPQFSRIRQDLTQNDIDELFNMAEKADLDTFQKINTKTGLAKLLQKEGGQIPTKSELKLLRKVYGKDFVKAITNKKGNWQKLLEGAANVLAVPRSIMASFDLSAPLRQGAFLIGRPKQWGEAFKTMLKAVKSDADYKVVMDGIKADPNYNAMKTSGLSLTDLGDDISSREELFASNLADVVPGVKGSGRAYTAFLNKLRADTFNDIFQKTGGKNAKDVAKFVNAATGRGDLGKLESASGALSTALFSPRLVASRLNLINPAFYVNLNPTVRKEALKSLASFTGAGLSVLTLAKLGGAEVENDPRNADFGKIKFGNTRYDIWAGFQQPLRALAQIASGKVISSQTGKEITLGEGYKPLTRLDIATRFLESKTSPVASFIISAIRGQNNIGQDFDVPSEVINRFIPMIMQDMYDLARDKDSPFAAAGGIPGIFGVGSLTYGKQELVTGKDQFGFPTSQIRPIPGLAESIREKVFGKKPLGTSRGFNVETYYDQLLELPREQASARFQQIAKSNPDLAKKISKVAKERQKGITVQNKTLKSKGVSSGDRATAIAKEFNKLKTNEEKSRLWQEYVRKGIITKDVAKQVTALLKNQ